MTRVRRLPASRRLRPPAPRGTAVPGDRRVIEVLGPQAADVGLRQLRLDQADSAAGMETYWMLLRSTDTFPAVVGPTHPFCYKIK